MRSLGLVLLACSCAWADTVVLRDGTILEGTVQKQGKQLLVGNKPVPLGDLLLWENGEGLLRQAPSPRTHYLGCVALARRVVRRLCRQRLAQAIGDEDAETARRLLRRAERARLDAKEAERWQARIGRITGDGHSSVAVPRNLELVDLLVDRARKQMDRDELRGLYLLRAALRIEPRHKAANDILDRRAPRRWKLGDKRNWLEWKIEVLPGVRLLKRRSSDLQRAKNFWGRKDLVGLETEDLILITPLRRTQPISMCLQLGELTCSALDEMFRIDKPKRDEFLPLVIYFYENRQEYVERSNRGMGRGPSATLGLTAGHYTPTENISRFFWPRRANAAQSVRDTFVHELTHHWIERRNPRWHESELAPMADRVKVPGYWVVEGFATFIQHSRFDRKKKTWTHFNPHANSMDVVAAISRAGKLLSWTMVYTLAQEKFHGELTKTATKAYATVKGRWSIRAHPISEVRLFYEQASATCMFLYWGERGKYRARLLDYVTDFYTSKPERTDIEAAFGLTPKALGAKVEAFCRAVIDQRLRPDRR